MAAAAAPAFDAELFGDNQQVVDASVARIVAHGIECFGAFTHGGTVSYSILSINPLNAVRARLEITNNNLF